MLEMLINPRKAERRPWEMFFVGIFYTTISILLVNWIFLKDEVLSKSASILVITFTVMFSIPFVYYIIKLEEERVTPEAGAFKLLKEHRFALYAFMWLFLGFVIGFSFWYIILPTTTVQSASIETYCAINRGGPGTDTYQSCVNQYTQKDSAQTGFLSNKQRIFLIFANNIYVLIFTIIFSLIFGAGVIFILAWNASVIASAIGIFTQSDLGALPLGLLRFMIHGIPEIGAYFVAAMAGGMISVAVIKHEIGSEKFWEILQDSLNLIIISVIVLFIGSLIEVFVTPAFFG